MLSAPPLAARSFFFSQPREEVEVTCRQMVQLNNRLDKKFKETA